jgi:hypothetical protein
MGQPTRKGVSSFDLSYYGPRIRSRRRIQNSKPPSEQEQEEHVISLASLQVVNPGK